MGFLSLGIFVPYAGPSCSRQELCVLRKEPSAAAGDGTFSLETTCVSLGDSQAGFGVTLEGPR